AHMPRMALPVWPTRPHSHRHTDLSCARLRLHQSHGRVSYTANHTMGHMPVWHR
ncbi:hypothetical protein J1N35_007684, partial [Gossypium stocksii]